MAVNAHPRGASSFQKLPQSFSLKKCITQLPSASKFRGEQLATATRRESLHITVNNKKEVFEIKNKKIRAVVIICVSLSVLGTMAPAAQDKYTVKALNGVAFSEFKGSRRI